MNWGHKVTIGFVAFVGMMSFLVYRCMQTHYDLVSKDYYKEELQYQQVIDGKARAAQLSSPVSISQGVLRFPEEMKEITGDVWFYCASDAAKDRKFNLQQIDQRLLLPGNYTVKVNWQCNGQRYYTELYTTIN